MAFNLTATISLVDRMTAPMRKMSSQMSSFTKQTNYTRDSNGRLRDEMGRYVGSGKKMSGALGGVTGSLAKLTGAVGATAIAMSMINKAMSFEAQMSSIKALTGASGAEMKQMTDLALDMGAKTKYSALEAASGIEELLKAGLTPAQVQAGALEAGLNLATAGGLDLAKASEIMSTALNAYKADAMTAADASNILAGTANASATSVEELQYGLSQVSAVASGIGMSFKDTNIALGLFANNGLKGSDGGTSLKTMLANLQPTTKAATEAFFDLGWMTKEGTNAFFDAKGELKSLSDISGLLKNSMKDMTSQQRSATLQMLFGSDAVRAANILFKEGADGVNKFSKEMAKVSALDVAKEKMNNAAGAVEQFKGALETLQISVLTPLMPVIRDGANAMSDWIANLKPEQIQSWGDNIKNAGQTVIDIAKSIKDNWSTIKPIIIGVTAAFIAFKTVTTIIVMVQTVITVFGALKTALVAVRAAMIFVNLAMAANPVGAIIVAIMALIAVGVYLYQNWDTVRKKTGQLWGKLGAFRGVAQAVLGPLGFIIRAAVTMAENWDGTKSVWENVWNGIKISASNAVNDVIGSINSLIGMINKIPGVNIPIIPKVHWGNVKAKAPTGTADFRALESGRGHAGGLSNVPYDGYMIRAHKSERLLTAEESKAYSSGKGGGNTYKFGDIHLHGVGGDLESAADKLLDIMVRKTEAVGGVGV